MEKKKICIITPGKFPVPAVSGGAVETLLENLIRQHKEDSNLEFVICSRYQKEAFEAAKNMNLHNVRFAWTPPYSMIKAMKHIMFRVIRKFTKKSVWQFCDHYGEIKQLILKEKFDLIIAEGGFHPYIMEITQNYEKSKLAFHLHHHYNESYWPKRYGSLIGVSQFVTDRYVQECQEEIKPYVLKNGIDLEKFTNVLSEEEKNKLKRKFGILPDDFVVLYSGRVTEVKGVKELVQAVNQLEDPHIKLLVVGGSNFGKSKKTKYLRELEDIVKGNEDKIKLVGYVKSQDIYKFLNISHVQCIPSLWEEAAPLALLEAMAAGVPTIVTDSGGMVEYVTKDTSIIVHRGEELIKEIKNAIIELKSDTERRKKMCDMARKHVQGYNQQHYYEAYINIVEDILARGEKNGQK